MRWLWLGWLGLTAALGAPVVEAPGLRAEFDGAKLVRLIGADGILFAEGDPDGRLFELVFRANQGRGFPLAGSRHAEKYEFPAIEQATLTSRDVARDVLVQQTGAGARFEWRGLDLPGDPGVVDVVLEVRPEPTGPGLEWRLAVANRSARFGLWAAMYPHLDLLPPGGTPDDDELVTPLGQGIVLKQPFDQEARRRQKFLVNGGGLAYPYPLNMSFVGLYDPAAGGLYLGAHDPAVNHKEFRLEPRDEAQRMGFHLFVYPPDMGQPGTGYSLGFPLITRPSAGHWYDVAQAYRGWALEQRWAAKGPLATRTDIPRWYKDSPLYLVTYTRNLTMADGADLALRFKEYFGYDGPVPLNWYQWKEYRPDQTSLTGEDAVNHAGNPFPAKPGFGEAVARLRANGIFVQPYVDTRVFDIKGGRENVPDEWLPYTVKDVNGVPRTWNQTYAGLIDICRATDFYQTYVEQTCVRLAREHHAAGAYLDQFGGLAHACFDRDHGHPLGGGSYQYEGGWAMAQRTREAVRVVAPDAVFTDENGADCFLDVLDGNLFHYDVRPGLEPVAMAVYGGRWIGYGRNLHGAMSDPLECRLVFGNTFVFGEKLGRFTTHTDLWLTDPKYAEPMALLKELVAWRVAATPWLQYGRMIRPPAFAPALPVVKVDEAAVGTEEQSDLLGVEQPAIAASCWQAPDGSVALVLFNVSRRNQAYRCELGEPGWPLDGRWSVNELARDGTETELRPAAAGPFEIAGELPADGVRILVLRRG